MGVLAKRDSSYPGRPWDEITATGSMMDVNEAGVVAHTRDDPYRAWCRDAR